MIATTYIKYLKISPKKIRTLAHSVVKLSTVKAIDRLIVNSNKSSKILVKAIQSAVANAANNLKMDKSKLIIKTIEVGKGPFLKRFNPVARGMAHQIKKRSTHLKISLEEMKIPLKQLPDKTMNIANKEIKKVEGKVKNGT